MNVSAAVARPMKPLAAGFLFVAIACLAVGWAAATVAASSGSHGSAPTVAPAAGVARGVPGVETTTQLGANVTTTGSVAGSSAMYPVPVYGSLGVAPEGTILAQGSGTADMKADGSDKAAALKKATDLALSDAHGQATVVAASMGVQVKAIYSISIATGTNYAYATPNCVVAPVAPGLSGGGSSSDGVGVSPGVCVQPMVTATSGQMVVTLTVAYTYA
jgi:hypothetical protein